MIERVYSSFLEINLADPQLNPTARFDSLNTLVGLIVNVATILGALIFGAMLMFAGYKVITSAGDPEKMQEARQTGTYAVVGMLIIILAFLIVRILAFVFGLEVPF